jgi:cyclopropane fatty-acyl-phospholipid synthase-like methyltransferase
MTETDWTIFDLFDGLDRAGPGDRESLDRALAGLAPDAAVLDAGCGRGADLPALLAMVPRGRVVAVDTAPAFIAHVRVAFPQARAEVADMASPPGGPFDAIWSAGAVYQIGVGTALAAWRAHLVPGGRVAFSDLCLTGAAAAPAVSAFFAAEGVTLRDAAALEAEVQAAGYRIADAFWLPPAAWEAYYLPLERRLGALPENAVARGFRDEIALWRAHGGDFGYRLVVARQ